MPVHRRADDQDICFPDLIQDFIELVPGQGLAIGVDPVIHQIQGFIFFSLQQSGSQGCGISLPVRASIYKQDFHDACLAFFVRSGPIIKENRPLQKFPSGNSL